LKKTAKTCICILTVSKKKKWHRYYIILKNHKLLQQQIELADFVAAIFESTKHLVGTLSIQTQVNVSPPDFKFADNVVL
jgi:hypothetical protein